ncbi:hypothetical protein LBUCD034_0933 [Lentilactobacillus buchneri subsp. silagei CD034]|uniref:Uncharacterized protein n=1 Tax=Lentilactobacillus buchneri subsp. silagei CD034 TaxID=1071400 RepID=J9W4Q6_LENBU|nr:hypothetical protein LBUCD034_0933 [Lentilactobacillus buchneri subsp. silagei CD034]
MLAVFIFVFKHLIILHKFKVWIIFIKLWQPFWVFLLKFIVFGLSKKGTCLIAKYGYIIRFII